MNEDQRRSITERLESWKRCIDGDDFSSPGIVRSNFNDLYLLLAELLNEKCPTGSSLQEK